MARRCRAYTQQAKQRASAVVACTATRRSKARFSAAASFPVARQAAPQRGLLASPERCGVAQRTAQDAVQQHRVAQVDRLVAVQYFGVPDAEVEVADGPIAE